MCVHLVNLYLHATTLQQHRALLVQASRIASMEPTQWMPCQLRSKQARSTAMLQSADSVSGSKRSKVMSKHISVITAVAAKLLGLLPCKIRQQMSVAVAPQ